MRKKKSTEINKEKDNSLILQKEYHEEIEEDILNYSLSAIVRAIPDARDGMKPVGRRLLFQMKQDHNTSSNPYKKSVRSVGNTLSKYHPHGDTSVYEALVRMAQSFKLNLPLIDGHGNFGSLNDGPAAMRYTEARLSKFAETMLDDLEKDVVLMQSNFDNSENEPLVLPCRVPNALINGGSGIATGISTSLPLFNAQQAIDSAILYLTKKNVSIDDLLKVMPGPDFPSGGIIVNKSNTRELYTTGQTKFIIRSKIILEKHKTGKDSLIITEIPYGLSIDRIVDAIIDLIVNRKLPEITEVRDESSKEGIRINLILKKEMTAKEIENLKNKLFKLTPLEISEAYNLMMTYNLRPHLFTMPEYFKVFLDFQREITTKKYQYLLNKYNTRKEILDGLIMAADIVDVIIETIRGSVNSKIAKNVLMTGDISKVNFKTKSFASKARKFKFSEIQASSILSLRLEQLSGLEILAFQKELTDLNKKIDNANKILSSEKALNNEIKRYMTEIRDQFATPRKTELIDAKAAEYKEQKIVEDVMVTIDKFGYLKLLSETNYNKLSSDELNNLTFDKKTNTEDKLFFFTKDGNAYSFKMEEIIKTKSASPRGILVDSLIESKNAKDAKPIFTCLESELKTMECLFVSSDGFIKRVKMDEFIVSKSILKATVLNDGAYIQGIFNTKGKKELILKPSSGKDVVREISSISTYRKVSRGIIGIRLKDGQTIEEIILK